MKIIFLDIDGVLNTDRQIRKNQLKQIKDLDFDTEAMVQLKRILEETKAKIVISSTWKTHRDSDGYLWREIIRNFNNYQIQKEVIYDVTPLLDENMKPETREIEIAEWIEQHKQVDKFIILDDQWSMGKLNKHFIRCQPFNGITEKIAEEVIKKLKD